MNYPIGDDGDGNMLDLVLEEYAATSDGPSYLMLVDWVRRYPQYTRELTNFTAAWTLAAPVSPPSIDTREEHATTLTRHVGIVRSMLDSQTEAAQMVDEAITGLVAEAQAKGLSRRRLAAALDLSIPLVDKLDRRLLRYTSIPAEIIDAVAGTLNRGRASVESYLQGAPLLPVGASYRADEAPALPPQEEFADAVRSDDQLVSKRKRELLEMAAE